MRLTHHMSREDMLMSDTEAGRFARSAVLFDFDGTLADTGPAVMRAAEYTLRTHGFDLANVGNLQLLIGPPIIDGFMEVAHLSREDAQGLVSAYRLAFETMTRPEDYPVFPGMAELVRSLSRSGVKVGVATSRLQHSAEKMIASLDLPPFDAIVGRIDQVRHTKAACVSACLDELGVAPSDAVLVGDRRFDVAGAHEIGLPCIGVYRDADAREELVQAGADALCTGAEEVAALLGCTIW